MRRSYTDVILAQVSVSATLGPAVAMLVGVVTCTASFIASPLSDKRLHLVGMMSHMDWKSRPASKVCAT